MEQITTSPDQTAVEISPNILAFGPNLDRLSKIAQSLRAGRVGSVVATFQGQPEQLAGAVARSYPGLLLLDIPNANLQTLDEVDRIEHLYPNMKSLLVCEDHSPEFLKRAMSAGVREVLAADIEVDALREVARRVWLKRSSEAVHEGKVLAFVSCNGGGSGATFLATNVAYELAAAQGRKVIVIDLNLQWGDAALFISRKKPTTTLADVAAQVHRVDSAYLASSLLSVHPKLGVLAAPEDPVQALDIKADHIDVLLRLARANYDFVILDIGGVLDSVTVRAMDHADVIYPVMQLSVPFLRDAKRLLKTMSGLDYHPDKIRLLVNRYQKGEDISLADVEETVGVKVCQTFPNDFAAVTDSINQGVPVMESARHSAIAKSIHQFALTLLPAHAVPTRGWMSRMLKRA